MYSSKLASWQARMGSQHPRLLHYAIPETTLVAFSSLKGRPTVSATAPSRWQPKTPKNTAGNRSPDLPARLLKGHAVRDVRDAVVGGGGPQDHLARPPPITPSLYAVRVRSLQRTTRSSAASAAKPSTALRGANERHAAAPRRRQGPPRQPGTSPPAARSPRKRRLDHQCTAAPATKRPDHTPVASMESKTWRPATVS